MERKEEFLRKLDAEGLLIEIPSHEIEEFLEIRLDKFDPRSRRPGYPKSHFYKDFSIEQADKEKLLAERLLATKLEGKFLFWRLAIPGKQMVPMLFFLAFFLVSLVCWVSFVFKGDLDGTYYAFMAALGSACALYLLDKSRFVRKSVVKNYNKSREEGYQDTRVLSRYQYQ